MLVVAGRQRRRSTGSPWVLFAGRIDHQKDPILAIDAMAALPNQGNAADARLLIAGEGVLRADAEGHAADAGHRRSRPLPGQLAPGQSGKPDVRIGCLPAHLGLRGWADSPVRGTCRGSAGRVHEGGRGAATHRGPRHGLACRGPQPVFRGRGHRVDAGPGSASDGGAVLGVRRPNSTFARSLQPFYDAHRTLAAAEGAPTEPPR